MASASVTVDKQLISTIGRGILVFAAVAPDDTQKEVEAMAVKVLKLKIWPDESGGTVRKLLNYSAIKSENLNAVEAKCVGYQRRSTLRLAEVAMFTYRCSY